MAGDDHLAVHTAALRFLLSPAGQRAVELLACPHLAARNTHCSGLVGFCRGVASRCSLQGVQPILGVAAKRTLGAKSPLQAGCIIAAGAGQIDQQLIGRDVMRGHVTPLGQSVAFGV